MSKNILNKRNVVSGLRRVHTKPAPVLPACDFVPTKYEGPSLEKLQSARSKHVFPLAHYYSKPLPLHQGYKQWLFDFDGKRYLDMFGGICTVSVGHAHPKITEAIQKQTATLGHCSNVYWHPKISEYAEKLVSKFPGNLKVAYFVNSGSEANDLATLLARCHTNNFEIISLRNGYHGMSYQVMGMSNLRGYRFPVPQPNGVSTTMNPDVFKGIWGGSRCRDSLIQTKRTCCCSEGECEAKEKYLEQLNEVYQHCMPKGRVAAFFIESIQGVGGTVQYPKGFVKGAYDMIKEYNGLFIADEVQTGFGRTGDHYWGFEGHGVQPDIVTMAKGIGNGYPMAAVVTTPEIAASYSKATHFNTFGGNPVACAVGEAVLDIIDEEQLQQNSKEVGSYLIKRLEQLRDFYKVVGDIRGKGLMLGVELVLGDGSTQPLPSKEFMEIWEECRNMGLILGSGGLNGNVFRIKPPMCITKEDADFTYDVLDTALDNHLNKRIRTEPVFISGI